MLNDDNIAGMMLELGAANALGVYVMLLLHLRTKDNYEASCRPLPLKALAKRYDVDVDLIGRILREFDLFEVDEERQMFRAPYLDRVMKTLEEKWRINAENGKKGGAPKGNKNAAKKKATEEPPINELFGDIAYVIMDIIFFEAQKENFAILDYLNKSQIATIAACCNILNIDDLSYFCDATMKECIMNTSAQQFCKVVKEISKCNFEGDGTFEKAFAENKQAADQILKMPLDEIRHFCDKWFLISQNGADIPETTIRENYNFSEDEIRQIITLRKQQNNPKTTQNNQI